MELAKPASDARVVLWIPHDGRLQRQDVTRMLATSAPKELRGSTNLEVKFSRTLDHVFVEVVLDNETIANKGHETKPKPQIELVSTKDNHIRRQKIRKIFSEIKSGDLKFTRCKVKGCRVLFHRREDAFKHTITEHLKDAKIKFTSNEKWVCSEKSNPSKLENLFSWSGSSKEPNYQFNFCTQHTKYSESGSTMGFGQKAWSMSDPKAFLDFANAIKLANKLQPPEYMEPFRLLNLADVSARVFEEPCKWTMDETNVLLQRKDSGFVIEEEDPTTTSPPCGASPSSSGEASSPDDSSDDEDLGRMEDLELQKALMVTRLLLRVHDMFTAQGDSFRSCNTGSGSTASKSQQRSDGSGNSSNHSRQSGIKRGRFYGEHGDNDDQNNKRPRDRTTLAPPDGDNGLRLACPFFKNNPHGTYSSRTCYGPGWKTMHRLKEHLYREHTMSIHCPRCCTTFRDETKLAEHSRKPEPCQIKQEISFAGLSKEQTAQLKCRKGTYGETEEKKKWNFVYLILFPDTGLNGIPSPYYEPNDRKPALSVNANSKHLPDDREFAYLQQELPRKLRRVLEAKVEKWIGPIEDLLHHQIEDIVSECLHSTHADFQEQPDRHVSSAKQTEVMSADTVDTDSVWLDESEISSAQLDDHSHNPMTPPSNDVTIGGESEGDPLYDSFPWDVDQALTDMGIFAAPFFDDFNPVFSQDVSAKSSQQTLHPDMFLDLGLDLDLNFTRR